MLNKYFKHLKGEKQDINSRICQTLQTPAQTSLLVLLPQPMVTTTNGPILKDYPYNASSYLKYPWSNSGPLSAAIQWLLLTSTLSKGICLYTYIFNTQQTSIGNTYRGALSILLNVPFHLSIVNCYRHLQGGYILQMTKIMLEHLGSIWKLAWQLDIILQLILTTKETITNKIKEVLELWITATSKKEMKVIRQLLNQLTNLEKLPHLSQMIFNALSMVDMTTSLISAQITNARNVDNKTQDIMRSFAFSKKTNLDQNSLSLKDKQIKPAITFLSFFPMNPSLPLLLASLPPDEDSWHVFSPRPKKTDKLTPILEEIVRTTYYSEMDSPLPDKSTTQPLLLVVPQLPYSL